MEGVLLVVVPSVVSVSVAAIGLWVNRKLGTDTARNALIDTLSHQFKLCKDRLEDVEARQQASQQRIVELESHVNRLERQNFGLLQDLRQLENR